MSGIRTEAAWLFPGKSGNKHYISLSGPPICQSCLMGHPSGQIERPRTALAFSWEVGPALAPFFCATSRL